tara:strand:- start:537 stop:1445 length:909 start_codon:yes stop_codon:yes gene_type:complete
MVSSEINKDLFLFYGVYDTKQLLINDLKFIPCIFENKYPWKHEFQIYKTIYNLVLKSQENEESIIGLFSSSLTERTGLNYQTVSKLINKSNADIFVFSPSQYNSLIFYNYWDQAEMCHEGIRKEVKQIFALNNELPKVDFHSRTITTQFSYCNFWAAKRDLFLKIVKDMICLDELMTENKLGLKETFHKSSFVKSFNKSFKKNYKLYPFIIERYLSSILMDKNKINPKVFYWKDNRRIIDQVEKTGNLMECLEGPIKRGKLHKSNKTIFENKKDFYKKIWLNEDIEKLDKFNPGAGERLKYL